MKVLSGDSAKTLTPVSITSAVLKIFEVDINTKFADFLVFDQVLTGFNLFH